MSGISRVDDEFVVVFTLMLVLILSYFQLYFAEKYLQNFMIN